MSLPLSDIEADMNATANDIANLAMIASCLRNFIANSKGEDRAAFKSDLFKYESLYSQAKNIMGRIEKAHATAKARK